MTETSGNWLKVTSWCLCLVGLAAALAVFERALAAGWQWYKFYGYDSGGFITLSKSTGIAFVVASICVAVLCVLVERACTARGLILSGRVARFALYVLCGSVLVYLTLGLSPLNVWRP